VEPEDSDSAEAFQELSRRAMTTPRLRRPWLLIGAALLLALLSALLWLKWRDARTRVDQLQVELRQLYTEAEALRTREARAQQRIVELERELQARPSAKTVPRKEPVRDSRGSNRPPTRPSATQRLDGR
jgi:cell division protein FtsB